MKERGKKAVFHQHLQPTDAFIVVIKPDPHPQSSARRTPTHSAVTIFIPHSFAAAAAAAVLHTYDTCALAVILAGGLVGRSPVSDGDLHPSPGE